MYDDKCEMVFTTGSPDSNQAYRWAGGHNTSAINGQTREPKLAFVTGRTWSSNVIGVDQLTTSRAAFQLTGDTCLLPDSQRFRSERARDQRSGIGGCKFTPIGIVL